MKIRQKANRVIINEFGIGGRIIVVINSSENGVPAHGDVETN